MENLISECTICESENIIYLESNTQYGFYCKTCMKISVLEYKSATGLCCKQPIIKMFEVILSNGISNYKNICINCFDKSSSIKKDEALKVGIYKKELLTIINEVAEKLRVDNLWNKFNKVKQNYYKQNQIDQFKYNEEKSIEWWATYNAYLQTPKWGYKRLKVFERDKYICQACLNNKATQVHHLTYKNVTDEPLFELISICEPCHKKLHKK